MQRIFHFTGPARLPARLPAPPGAGLRAHARPRAGTGPGAPARSGSLAGAAAAGWRAVVLETARAPRSSGPRPTPLPTEPDDPPTTPGRPRPAPAAGRAGAAPGPARGGAAPRCRRRPCRRPTVPGAGPGAGGRCVPVQASCRADAPGSSERGLVSVARGLGRRLAAVPSAALSPARDVTGSGNACGPVGPLLPWSPLLHGVTGGGPVLRAALRGVCPARVPSGSAPSGCAVALTLSPDRGHLASRAPGPALERRCSRQRPHLQAPSTYLLNKPKPSGFIHGFRFGVRPAR